MVEHDDPGGTWSEVHLVAGEVVRLVAENVVESEAAWHLRDRLHHQRLGEGNAAASLVDRGAVVREERHRALVLDLHTERAEEVERLADDPLDQALIQKLQSWAHGFSPRSGTAGRLERRTRPSSYDSGKKSRAGRNGDWVARWSG